MIPASLRKLLPARSSVPAAAEIAGHNRLNTSALRYKQTLSGIRVPFWTVGPALDFNPTRQVQYPDLDDTIEREPLLPHFFSFGRIIVQGD